ncbi:Homeodomain-like super protein [Datura stramonium]|uniref:Homeodomain-like super protein n=1 Tax=Datura stramonium TaxID=4076 RepID=A0ABS8T5K8_DATST|nr:Homeodomain-like super protein [Datura stramonium]
MSSSSTALSTEAKESNQENLLLVGGNLSNNGSPREQEAGEEKSEHHSGDCNRSENENEYDEDEEEDMDFNPLLKETVSLDASSSLSSEIEGLDADVVDSGENIAELRGCCKERLAGFPQDCLIGDKELGEEIVMQSRASSGACPEDLKILSSELKERESTLDTKPESGISNNKKSMLSGGGDRVKDLSIDECNNIANSRRAIIDMDNDDAICKRTRARYSLASFTLDELETFLQETDDEDDLQNVNDEEEYRKFLAAVLHGGDGNSGDIQDNENVDDEDEDNDADFELEIEEALESDLDEHVKNDIEEEYEAVGRRPKTRQTMRQRASVENKKKVLGLSKRPLRPLLPYLPISPYSIHGAKSMMPCSASSSLPRANDGFVNGFTPHQIGQLHCLIHEHVQLLIQVFSICVLEPAKRHIASNVGELISQMLHKRDEVLASRSVPYPSFCFFSPYVCPSVSDEPLHTSPVQITGKMSSAHDLQGDCSSGLHMVQPCDSISPSRGRHEAITNNQVGCPLGSWVPYISGPVLSVLDVAPIKLVKDFMDDVSHVVQDYQCRQLGGLNDSCSEKEPLFPLQNIHFTAEPDGRASLYSNIGPPSSSFRKSKKTMAAVLVEKAKKQAVAPVPNEIAKLAQRFYPLFNPALYPHKPPPAVVANRMLFTDAEDELLAMGLMEYNTDWKAIQQRYLPCKSKHQIFVRQKNRSSSKAPENPIKAVRRMKNSPLTAEEVARIEEGLKVFKLDWMSVWKFIVPYRDPSLLPRQWRTAIGTQKSYKSDASKRAKRRLYDLERKKLKAAALETWHISSRKKDDVAESAVEENCGADICTDRDEEAYVHEAFLADWRPAVSSIQVNHSMSNPAEKIPPLQLLGVESSQVAEKMNNSGSRNWQSHISNEFPVSLRSSETESFSRPYRARKFNNGQLVKLAPGLPPVNLPPSVRVMSQSAFKSYHVGTYPRPFGGDTSIGDGVRDNAVSKITNAAKPYTNYFVEDGPFSSTAARNNISDQNLQETSVSKDNKNVAEGKDESGLKMHPLLFRTPEDGPLPYCQSNSSFSTSSSFNFFSGCQPQLNLSLFHHPRQLAHTVNFLDKSSNPGDKTSISSGFDFHPLLQRTDDANCDLEVASSVARPSCTSESSKGRCTQVQNDVYSSSNVACSIPSSPMEKSNEVDLEMHLSFTSRKQKAVGSRVADHFMERSPTCASGDQNPQYSGTPNRTTQHSDSGATARILSSDEETGNDVDDLENQSLAEIVMEQEELSDSEEEIGESVEFECEEMEDSEGEEIFESEEITNDENEPYGDLYQLSGYFYFAQELCFGQEMDKVALDDPYDQHVSNIHGNSKGNSCSITEGHATRFDKAMDDQPSSLCLNLNPPRPVSPQVKSKSRHSSGSAGKAQDPTCSRRSGKKARRDRDRPMVNSRKRTRRTDSRKKDTSLNAETNVESPNSTKKDEYPKLHNIFCTNITIVQMKIKRSDGYERRVSNAVSLYERQGGVGGQSTVSTLIEAQRRGTEEIERLTMLVAQRDAGIAILKASQSSAGPGALMDLQEENARLQSVNASLKTQLEELTRQMICDQRAANERIDKLLAKL